MKIFEKFVSKFRKKNEFNNILEIADDIARKNPSALVDLVRLLGRSFQSQRFVFTAKYKERKKNPNLNPRFFWFSEFDHIGQNEENLFSIRGEIKGSLRPLDLNADLILPWPWNRDRYVDNLCYIGPNRNCGHWVQDTNHRVSFWLPQGIGWVMGGNHSLMNGIINGQGQITKYEAFDISPVFDFVYCDGAHFIRKHDNKKISKVTNVEFAAIFEIGRIMKEHNITA